MQAKLRSIIFSPGTLLTFLVELLLLMLSVYGFGQGAHDIFLGGAGSNFDALILLSLLGIAPLSLFVFIAVFKTIKLAQVWSGAGFQIRIDELQKRMNEQEDFFQIVNRNTSSLLAIYGDKNEYWFINANAAQQIGLPTNEIVGKTPVDVLGGEPGLRVVKNLDLVRNSGAPFDEINQGPDRSGGVSYLQTSYRPLPAFGNFPGGVMASSENVTSIVIERERREDMLRQIISTLVAVVDRRDPYASGHSSHVGQLSLAIAAEMKLSDRNIEAAEIAGSLMNFGKVLISRSILTKTDSLTVDELQRIRDGILTSAEILSIITFSAPVVPTLSQVLERFDGTGEPKGLQGEAILITARIVAVANAFVAMVSPRAYRPGLDASIATQRLAQDAGKAFDPKVISALERLLTNIPAKLDWIPAKKDIG